MISFFLPYYTMMKCFSPRLPFLCLILGLWSSLLIATTQAQQQAILDMAKATNSLSTLVTAVQKADAAIASTLPSLGPFSTSQMSNFISLNFYLSSTHPLFILSQCSIVCPQQCGLCQTTKQSTGLSTGQSKSSD